MTKYLIEVISRLLYVVLRYFDKVILKISINKFAKKQANSDVQADPCLEPHLKFHHSEISSYIINSSLLFFIFFKKKNKLYSEAVIHSGCDLKGRLFYMK